MSDGLKIGLVVAAGAAVLLLVHEHTAAAAAVNGIPSIGGSTAPLATAPGASPSIQSTPATPSGSRTSTIEKFAILATVAPVYYPTKAAIAVAKPVVGAVEQGAKAIGSAASSVFNSIF